MCSQGSPWCFASVTKVWSDVVHGKQLLPEAFLVGLYQLAISPDRTRSAAGQSPSALGADRRVVDLKMVIEP